MRLRRPRADGDLLNITPLIDVVFILLVFFMLATTFARYRMIGVDAPKETRVVNDSDGAVVILLHPDGAADVDGAPAPDGDIAAAVAEILMLDPNRRFIVRPEEGVDLQAAISAYDAARGQGARRVSFSNTGGTANAGYQGGGR